MRTDNGRKESHDRTTIDQLDIRKVTARIGAASPAATGELARTVAAIRAALNEHKALVFARATGRRGPAALRPRLRRADRRAPDRPGPRRSAPRPAVDSERGRANHWHTDVTFVVNPPQPSTLRSIVVPPYGGETLIANSAAAYRDLPEPLRAFADTL